ncbi:MAG: hypothetical protein NC341_07270 [Blautia sp.]|nr:hypothetical protein [Blautia sp.]MCM1199734.1 hypothetical protein [Bacteroides fragilis]
MKNDKKRTPKQIAALLCVIILVLMYLITLIVACLDFPGADKMFAACLLTTVALPILLWLFIWFYGMMKERQAEAAEELPKDGGGKRNGT